MKKFIISAILILGFGSYVLFKNMAHGHDDVNVIPPPSLSQTPSGGLTDGTSAPSESTNPNASGSGSTGETTIPTTTPTTTPTTKPITKPSTLVYKNGTYTSPVEDAFYGNVQISVSISNDKITAVKFLQYPNDRGTSVEINSQATPYLVQEALQSQKANVDVVSGATQTSEAFIRAMNAVLSEAKA